MNIAVNRSLTLIAVALAVFSSSVQAEVVTFEGETMGSVRYTVRVVRRSTEPAEGEQAEFSPSTVHREIDAVLERINGRMSTYLPSSELSRFNSATSTDWFPVSEETSRVVAKAIEIAKLSGGAFDPTVGKLVRIWSFGAGPRSYEAPDEQALAAARESVGYEHIQVRHDPPAIRKGIPQAELDLSAIAKGYAVDAVAEKLGQLGFDAYMVEIGGEVRTAGTKVGGRPWRIAIERPNELGRSIERVLELTDASLATSGDYRNYFEEDGVRYSHTIDPATGRPVTHQLASASILAEDCMTADALATTLMVLGPEKGLQFADRHGVAAFLLTRTDDGFTNALSQAGQRRFSFVPFEEPGESVAKRGSTDSRFWVTVGLALGVFCLAVLGLGAGLLLSSRPLRGSCGGLSTEGGSACQLCSSPRDECEEFRQRISAEAAKPSSPDREEQK